MQTTAAQPQITAAAIHLPDNLLGAQEIDDWIGEPHGWTEAKTGVMRRRFAAPSENVANLGAAAITRLVNENDIPFDSVDAIVSFSASTHQILPATSAMIAEAVGPETNGIETFDIGSSCVGFITALKLLHKCMPSIYRRVILVAAEIPSRGLDPNNKESAALFGDAAVALLYEVPEDDVAEPYLSKVIASKSSNYIEGARLTEVRLGCSLPAVSEGFNPDIENYKFQMDGRGIFKVASQYYPNFLTSFLEETDYEFSDFDFIIPHQASKPAIRLIAAKVDVEMDRICQDFVEYGNTVAASIPIGLVNAIKAGRLKKGDKAFLTGTAAGLTLSAMIVEI